MKDRYRSTVVVLLTVLLVGAFVIYSGLVDSQLDAKGMRHKASAGDAAIIATDGDAYEDVEIRPFMTPGDAILFNDEELLFANVAAPDYRPVGNMHPMTNDADWWSAAKSYITSTFGVVDGQYNTSDTAPPAGSIWCAGLVSRVINSSYPNGGKIGVTESVDTLYHEITASGDYEFIGEGYVSDFVDVIESTKAGDIMLLMAPTSGGGWKWSHTNLITYYGYIYSQGAGGKIRMNSFDSYNQYGAYDPTLSSGYYYYIYRYKSAPSSYLGLKKTGSKTGNAYNNVWFEAYDESGNYLGAYLTGAASDESGGYAYYLRNSEDDVSYVQSDGGIPLPVGSTVYLYEQGVKSGNNYVLPTGASGYAGIKGTAWNKVRGPQKEYYIEATTLSYDNWTAANAYKVSEPEDEDYDLEDGIIDEFLGKLSLQKKTKIEYNLYVQDKNRFSLEGARYQIQSEDGKLNYYLETDSSGIAYLLDSSGKRTTKSTIEDVPKGRYFCWETKAGKGYKIDSECSVNNKKTIVISDTSMVGEFESNEIPEVGFRGGIQLIKRSTESFTAGNNNYDLKAEYTVYNSSGTEVGKINTTEQGTGYIGGLPAGKYTIKETKPGKGYTLDETVYTADVSLPAAGTYIYKGVDYSAVFDPAFYKSKYSDLSGLSNDGLLKHFAEHGLNEGRRASAYFDVSYYSRKKGLSNYDAFKYYVGFGMYSNESASSDDFLNQEMTPGVYQNSTSKPVIISAEKPDGFRNGLSIEKYDKYSGRMTVEGEGSLEGAEFEVSYYAVDTLEGIEEKEPDSVWHISSIKDESINENTNDNANEETVEEDKYVAKLSNVYMSSDFEQSELYADSNGNIFVPFGVIKIEEITSPIGYTINNVVYEVDDSSKSEPIYLLVNSENTFSGKVKVYDEAIRGNIKLEKRDYSDDKPMSGVEFEVKSNKTGESIIITTDENGFATTAGLWMSCTDDGEEVEKKEGVGALPYGEYTVTELRCEANKGKQLEPPILIRVEEELTYDVYDPSNNEPIIRNVPLPEIGTMAHEKDSELDTIALSKDVTFVDTVSYKYLKSDTEYTLLGKLMIKDENGKVTEMQKDGKSVTAVKTFKTESGNEKSVYEKSGSVDVVFEGIDVSGLEGKSLVFYEYLYLGDSTDENKEYEGYEDENIFPVIHADDNDENQTLHVAKIGTKAHGKSSDSNTITRGKDTVIVDTVRYENVSVGETYDIEGVLYDKKTGEAILVDGEEIKGKASFTAENASGETEIEFTFDSEKINSSSIVVFESMFDTKGRVVAEHKDINDEDQTIVIEEKTVTKSEENEDLADTEKASSELLTGKNPKTGDSFTAVVSILYMIISGIIIALIVYKKRNKKE